MNSKKDKFPSKYLKLKKRIKQKWRKRPIKANSESLYVKLFLLKIFKFILLFIFLTTCFKNIIYRIKYTQDDLTLITAYYRIKSKHTPEEYLKWINNFVLLNKSIVFFTNKEFMPTLKEIRPKELYYKSIFIEKEIEDFYSYKNFYKEFNESFYIDIENSSHNVPLYLIWAEKNTFAKKVIKKNYFNSKCFYWIDSGYFRNNKDEIDNLNKMNWPSTKKCLEDNRMLIGQIKEFSDEEKNKIINFDLKAHYRLQKDVNVMAGFFGGQPKNFLKFINLYYLALKLFIKNKIFIGKDQNIFAYVCFANPKIIKLHFSKDWFFLNLFFYKVI